MREVGHLKYGICAALLAALCGCAVGAPERPEWAEEEAVPESYGIEGDADGGRGRGDGARPNLPSAPDEDEPEPNEPNEPNEDDVVEPEPQDDPDDLPGDDGSDPTSHPVTNPAPDAGVEEPVDDPSCTRATLLWSEGFESGDYRNWTGQTYNSDFGDDCQDNGISTEMVHGGTHAQRSQITCVNAAGTAHGGSGGLQFNGDELLAEHTNTGVGIDAEDGIVNTTWLRLDSDTVFEGGRWISLLSVHANCSWDDATDQVLGVSIADGSGQLTAAHYEFGEGGTRTLEEDAPAVPRHAWVRLTTYLNFHTGVLHVWQDGRSVQHVTFSRPLHTLCHLRWGLNASGNNDAIVLFEDDNSLWKLGEPWTDFDTEPYLGESVAVCN